MNNHFHGTREIAALSVGESDVKFDKAVLEFFNSTWREYEEELCYDTISGAVIVKEFVVAARKIDEECWENAGKGPGSRTCSQRRRR